MTAVHTLQGQRTAHGVQQADDEAYINSVKGVRPAVSLASEAFCTDLSLCRR